MTQPPDSRLDVVVCEKHGLRYNRATEGGCVRCRRESGAHAGGATAGTATPASRVSPAPHAAAPPASTAVQLLLAALLIAGTGTLCWSAHQAVVDSLAGGVLATSGKATAAAAAAPGERHAFDIADPAAWPPPRRDGQPTPLPGLEGRGPAEQQKQIEELFRQMREDEQKERAGAAAPTEPQPPQ